MDDASAAPMEVDATEGATAGEEKKVSFVTVAFGSKSLCEASFRFWGISLLCAASFRSWDISLLCAASLSLWGISLLCAASFSLWGISLLCAASLFVGHQFVVCSIL